MTMYGHTTDGTTIETPDDGSGFEGPTEIERMDAEMERLRSLEDNGAPIVLEQQPDDEPVEPTEPEPIEPIEPIEPEPALPESVTIDGQEYPTALLREFIQFDNFLKANPLAAERMKAAFDPETPQPSPTFPSPIPQPIAPQPPVSQQPTQLPEPQLPEDFDLEDPANRYIADQFQILRTQQDTFNQYLAQQNQRTTSSLIQQGVEQFRASNPGLTDNDMVQIRNAAVQFDTIDRLAERGFDIPTATVQALDYAMWSIPAIRDSLFKSQQQQLLAQQKEDQARSRKLTALSGGNGSTGRATTPPAPEQTGPGALRRVPNEMVAAIREMTAANQ